MPRYPWGDEELATLNKDQLVRLVEALLQQRNDLIAELTMHIIHANKPRGFLARLFGKGGA